MAYKLFEENKVREALKQANSLLVPGLGVLASNPCEGDMEVLESVREEWCQYLTHPGLSEGTVLTTAAAVLSRIFSRFSESSALKCIEESACSNLLLSKYLLYNGKLARF